MKISDFGGEFKLIDHLASITRMDHPDVLMGIGDDAAVIRTGAKTGPFTLVTTDILLEGNHFKSSWSEPEQIGIKAVECNASDIAAMGGKPAWLFSSLVLSDNTTVAWAERLYKGMAQACRKYGIVISGGDMAKGETNTITITLLGTVSADHLCLRSQARAGDMLIVTGTLGASAAALALLQNELEPSHYLLEKHLIPTCRLDVSDRIAPLANAMIDISDGLASEIGHICKQSCLGADIFLDKIPLHDDVRNAAGQLGTDPVQWALTGGEDYELLFTICQENFKKLSNSGLNFHHIGTITSAKDTLSILDKNGNRSRLPAGYNHFL
ncbi:MAG: thiamine-phosphate kinase [Desulfobacteraceae bacterium]|nr:thiamine-phosphate kinase [Desulfobacteraceae bacterium]